MGCGVVVDPDDVEGIAEAIVRLDRDRGRAAEMARRAMVLGGDDYSWQVMAATYCRLNSELAGNYEG